MATSPQALSRLQLQTIAQSSFTALGLDTTRVKLGLCYQTPGTGFLSNLKSAGPYLVIMPAVSGEFDTTTDIMPYTVECVLWVGYDNWADQTFTAVEDLLTGTNGIVTKFKDYSLYGTTTPALHIEPGGPTERTDLSPIIVNYSIRVHFMGAN